MSVGTAKRRPIVDGVKKRVRILSRLLRRDLEQIDYEELFRIRPYLQGLPYWVGAAAVGLCAVLYSQAFTLSIKLSRSVFEHNPLYLFLLSPFCFFLSVWLVERFAPLAGGTGIPRVVEAIKLDGKESLSRINDLLSLRVALVVALSSLLCVLGAGGLGREGPMIHIAACLFYFAGTHFGKHWPFEEHRSWIIAGGAAGIAAAFNAPLAGVVFVLEELSHQHFNQFKNVVIASAIVAGAISQWLTGKYLFLGYPPIAEVPWNAIWYAALLGLICGALAFPFRKMIAINWREGVPRFFRGKLKFSLLVGLAIAALANFIHPHTIGGGTAVVESLLFTEQTADLRLIIGRFLTTSISHFSGCAGGFLAPSLALGAAVGSKLALALAYPQQKLLVLAGMSAFLSAVMRTPFTAWVIVMEMTDRHSAIFPLMVASLVANATIGRITASFKRKKPPAPLE